MSGYTRQEVAQRAGVDPDYVDQLVQLGILTPDAGDAFSPGDVLRARWLQSFEGAGVPLKGMAAAVRDGALSFSYLDATAFDRFAGLSGTTFRQLSARTGIPLELLMVVREAFGFAEPGPEDPVREDELSVVPVIELQLANGFHPVVIERWLRVCGDSLRRIVETETAWWHSEVMTPLLASGLTEGEMLEAQADLGSRMAPLREQAVLAIYYGQQEHAWNRETVEHVEGALERAGLYRRMERPPAMCFLDITGYTRLTEERGDEAAADLATRLATLVRRASQEHGGTPVKWLGDGVMFYFREPGAAALAALEMVEVVGRDDLPPAHVGIHAGPVVFQDGDYFGRTVNLASRIADYARPGEVLVSQEVVDASEEGPVTFTEIGPVELKGVPGTLRLHIARRPAGSTR
ncbi:MAG TPA: adenylate/guanylate cyclase domain-containing protein [Actinomycetota bacterium]|nr:adenylate/guanylate cyclase domain-containing protein [Actinomycetota bacterium]